MKLIYTQCEIYNPNIDETFATVAMIDDAAAKVEITTPMNLREWLKLAPLIEQALKQMQLKGDLE